MSAADRRKYVRFALVTLVAAAGDQLTKIWAREHLRAFGARGMSVLGRGVVFVYAENPGIAFSQLQGLQGGRVLLSLVSAVGLALVFWYVARTPATERRTITALGLICGGALGNMIDRVLLGSVTDFVRVDLGFRPFHPWPVFNVADAELVAGVALMILSMAARRGKARG